MVWHIIDVDPCEIGLACHRTNGSEIICLEMNPINAGRRWIWERFETRAGRGGGQFHVASPK